MGLLEILRTLKKTIVSKGVVLTQENSGRTIISSFLGGLQIQGQDLCTHIEPIEFLLNTFFQIQSVPRWNVYDAV